MKCKACGHIYSADLYQPAPGGSSALGVHFIFGIVLLVGLGLLSHFQVDIWRWVLLGVGVYVLIQVPVAWSDCRRNGGYCPECKTTNTVYPWSL